MKLLHLEIHKCSQCPYSSLGYCRIKKTNGYPTSIPDLETIPDWCPLTNGLPDMNAIQILSQQEHEHPQIP
ncbi:MAG TPA: hypothetical protein VK203_10815 [Nostocaceae cyanobacterium]|nr:hypothetical protein [Nostocaceae cyanobacterium]